MNKYKFKDPSAVIHLRGGEKVHAGNLTDEKYAELIKLSPGHADQFEEVAATPMSKKSESK